MEKVKCSEYYPGALHGTTSSVCLRIAVWPKNKLYMCGKKWQLDPNFRSKEINNPSIELKRNTRLQI